MLIAVQNVQADLRAGFTSARDMSSHGNGYADVEMRDAINQGRIDGPRYQVSTLGIVWSASLRRPKRRESAREHRRPHRSRRRRAAVRDQVAHGADWIKLFPGGALLVRARPAKPQYVTTYPLPVLQAIIDETHKLGKKAGCHVFGGDGPAERHRRRLRHGRARVRADAGAGRQMAAKKLFYDPTLQRYIEPYMDDNDAKNTGGKYRMIPIFEGAVRWPPTTRGLKIMVGSGADGSTYAHGTQALDSSMLVKRPGCRRSQASRPARSSTPKRSAGWTRSARSRRANSPTSSPCPAIPLADITQLQHVGFVMKAGKVVCQVRNREGMILLCVLRASFVASWFLRRSCGAAVRSGVSEDDAGRLSRTPS